MRRIALLIVSCAVVAGACGGGGSVPSASMVTSTATATGGATATPTSASSPSDSSAAKPSVSIPAGWKDFTPDDGSFSIAFSGTPTTASASQASDFGTVEGNTYSLVVGDTTYQVTQERFPAGTLSELSAGDLDQFAGGLVTGLVTAAGGVASNQTGSTFVGHAAKTATITAGTKAEDVVAFVFANDAYILLVVHTAGVTVDAAQFFNTFQLP
jgi:hypothetical protein